MSEVRESQFADRAARTVVTVAAVGLVLAGGWEVTQKVIQVPNVAAALFREETAVRLVDVPQERAPRTGARSRAGTGARTRSRTRTDSGARTGT